MSDSINIMKEIIDNPRKLEQIARIAFDNVDTDKSGEIDENELKSVMRQIAGNMGTEPPSSEDVEEVMEYLDTDHSGKIDFSEFKVLIKDVLTNLSKEV